MDDYSIRKGVMALLKFKEHICKYDSSIDGYHCSSCVFERGELCRVNMFIIKYGTDADVEQLRKLDSREHG